MDFALTPEQEELRQATIDFASAQLNDNLAERERSSYFSRDDWRKCADFGILGLNVPEEYGGQARDIVTTVAVLEALGYGCSDNGLPFGLNSQMWSTQAAVLEFGSERQKKDYLRPMCSGDMIGAFAITEADSGSDTYNMKSTARRQDEGYLLQG